MWACFQRCGLHSLLAHSFDIAWHLTPFLSVPMILLNWRAPKMFCGRTFLWLSIIIDLCYLCYILLLSITLFIFQWSSNYLNFHPLPPSTCTLRKTVLSVCPSPSLFFFRMYNSDQLFTYRNQLLSHVWKQMWNSSDADVPLTITPLAFPKVDNKHAVSREGKSPSCCLDEFEASSKMRIRYRAVRAFGGGIFRLIIRGIS